MFVVLSDFEQTVCVKILKINEQRDGTSMSWLDHSIRVIVKYTVFFYITGMFAAGILITIAVQQLKAHFTTISQTPLLFVHLTVPKTTDRV